MASGYPAGSHIASQPADKLTVPARTRERALALFDITQHRCATQVAERTGRRAHTVMDWVHAYNQGGPDALAFRRTGGRRPLFAHAAKPNSARLSAPPNARPRRRP